MLKRAYVFLIVILLMNPCFSESKVRIDEYRNYTVRIAWSSKYTKGPDNTNWAKKNWPEGVIKALENVYLLNPKNAYGKGRVVIDRYVYGSGYKYSCILEVWAYYPEDNEWQKLDKICYLPYEDSNWFFDFNRWANIYEMYLNYDEMGEL